VASEFGSKELSCLLGFERFERFEKFAGSLLQSFQEPGILFSKIGQLKFI
jgi:hypothetical protein